MELNITSILSDDFRITFVIYWQNFCGMIFVFEVKYWCKLVFCAECWHFFVKFVSVLVSLLGSICGSVINVMDFFIHTAQI